MKEYCQEDEWDVDCWQIAGKPLRKVNVGNRTASRSKGNGKPGERTVESIRREDQAFAADHPCRYCCTEIGALLESCVEHVDHARFDREPGQGVNSLDSHERCLRVPSASRLIGLCPHREQSPICLISAHHDIPLYFISVLHCFHGRGLPF